MKSPLIRLIAAILLILSMMFILPSPAVIAEDMQTEAPASTATMLPELPMDLSGGPLPNPAGYSADNRNYEDESISIKSYDGRDFGTNYQYYHIKIKHPSQLRTAPASKYTINTSVRTTQIARRVNAVMAINGDFFIFYPDSFAIRQGHAYKNRHSGRDILLIDQNGDFHGIIEPKSKEETEQAVAKLEADGKQIINAFTFGPVVIESNQARIPDEPRYKYFNIGAMKPTQRITFSQLGPLEYMVIATEGPDNKNSKGMTLYQVTQVTLQKGHELSANGCLLAYNLDGGSSSTVVMNNQKINAIGAKNRYLFDIIYFASLVQR